MFANITTSSVTLTCFPDHNCTKYPNLLVEITRMENVQCITLMKWKYFISMMFTKHSSLFLCPILNTYTDLIYDTDNSYLLQAIFHSINCLLFPVNVW